MVTSRFKAACRCTCLALTLSSLTAFAEEGIEPQAPPADLNSIFDYLAEERAPIVTIASFLATTLAEAPAIITVITATDIDRFGVRTLEEALRLVPGYYTATSKTGELRVAVRQRSSEFSEGVKVLIDGHSVVEPWHGSSVVAFGSFNMSNVERLEVIRGPGSAVHGSNAFVGVIDIVTKKRKEDVATLRLDGGTLDRLVGSLHTGRGYGQHHLTLNASLQLHPNDGRIITKDSLLGTANEAHALSAEARRIGGELPTGVANTERAYYSADVTYAYGDNTQVSAHYIQQSRGDFAGDLYQLTYQPGANNSKILEERYWLNAQHQLELRDTAHLTFSIFGDLIHDSQDLQLTIPGYTARSQTSAGGLRRIRTNQAYVLGGAANLELQLPLDNQAVVGVGYEQNIQGPTRQLANFDPQFDIFYADDKVRQVADFTAPHYTRQILSAFAEDRWQLMESLAVTSGLRVERYNDFGVAWSPRLSAVMNLDNGFSAKALWGQAFRAPALLELFVRGDAKLAGNIHLKAERASTAELQLGYRGEDQWLNTRHKLRFMLTGYRTQIKDAVRPDYEAALEPPYRLINVDVLEYYGMELEAQVPLLSFWRLEGYCTVARSAGKNKQVRVGADVPTASAMFSSAWDDADLGDLRFFAVVWGRRPRQIGDARPDLPLSMELNASYLSPTYTWMEMAWRLRLGGRNLLGSDLRDPSPLYRGERGELAFPDDLPRVGRSLWGSIEGTWE